MNNQVKLTPVSSPMLMQVQALSGDSISCGIAGHIVNVNNSGTQMGKCGLPAVIQPSNKLMTPLCKEHFEVFRVSAKVLVNAMNLVSDFAISDGAYAPDNGPSSSLALPRTITSPPIKNSTLMSERQITTAVTSYVPEEDSTTLPTSSSDEVAPHIFPTTKENILPALDPSAEVTKVSIPSTSAEEASEVSISSASAEEASEVVSTPSASAEEASEVVSTPSASAEEASEVVSTPSTSAEAKVNQSAKSGEAASKSWFNRNLFSPRVKSTSKSVVPETSFFSLLLNEEQQKSHLNETTVLQRPIPDHPDKFGVFFMNITEEDVKIGQDFLASRRKMKGVEILARPVKGSETGFWELFVGPFSKEKHSVATKNELVAEFRKKKQQAMTAAKSE